MEITKDSTKKDLNVIKHFVRGIAAKALARRDRKDRNVFGPGERINSVLDEKDISDEEGDEKAETLLDHLVNVSDDPELIQDELINILIAGRDTTASCITFAVYLLSQHPEVLQKLREEVQSVLAPSGTDSPTEETSSARAPSLEDLRKMPYLRAVINETLRLFPSVPLNVRDNIAERVWTGRDGTRWYLPAGTSITYSLLHIHRSPKLWGPTSQQFDPSRFLPSDPRYQTYYASTPFVFMPFNAGPRSCLGQQLASAEAGVFLCRLIQRLGGQNAIWRLDEDAIPEAARVPKEWAGESKLRTSSASSELPTFATESPVALLPESESGVSPRRAVEKVWPKSHLTMFVEGGLWMEFAPDRSSL